MRSILLILTTLSALVLAVPALPQAGDEDVHRHAAETPQRPSSAPT